MKTSEAVMMLGMAILVASPVWATNYAKLDTTSLQLNTSNWSGTPTSSDVGEFGDTPSSTTLSTLTLGGNVAIGGLQFDNNMTGPVTIGSGNTLTLNEAGIAASLANQNVTINCAIALGSGQTWTMAAGKTLTINNAVTGNYALTNAGSGTLTFTFWNTSMSSLNVAAGATTEFAGGGGPGSGSALSGSGTVVIDGGNADWRPFANNQQFTGTFLTQGDGVIDFGNSATSGWSSNATYLLNGPYLKIFNVNGTIDLGALSGNATIVSWYNGCTPTLSVGARGDSTTFAGTIVDTLTGSGGVISLSKTGAGTLTLSGANTYTGVTTINAGTLQANNAAALGNGGTITFKGGVLQYTAASASQDWASRMKNSTTAAMVLDTGAQSVTLGGIIGSSNTGGLTKQGTGTLTLSGVNTYSGGTAINAGTLTIGGAGQLGGGTYAGAITVNTVLNYNSSAAQTFSGVVAGSGTLVHSGSSTLTLSFWNVAINSLNVAAGSTVEFSGAGGGGTSITGSGTIIIDGGSTDWRPSVNNQPFAGTFLTQGAGVIDFGNSTTLGWSSNATYILNGPYMKIFSVNGTIDLGALSGIATIGTWYNGCTPTLRVGALGTSTTFAGTMVDNLGSGGTLSLVKTGVGALTLSGANTFTGTTVVNGGTLTLAQSAALQGSKLDYNNYGGHLSFGTLTASTLGALAGGQDLALGNNTSVAVALTVGNNGQSSSYGGVLSGAGSLEKTGAGSQTLSGANTYSGGTIISAGTLTLGANEVLADAGTVTINAGALNVNGKSETIGALIGGGGTAITLGSGALMVSTAATTTYGGIISGSGSLTKTGVGTQTLAGNCTYTGATTVNQGTLTIGGSGGLGGGNYAGAITVNGVFNYNSSAAQTFSGVVAGSGTLAHSGSSTLTLSFWNVAINSLNVAAGSTVELSGGGGGGSSITGSGTVIIDGGSTDWRPYVNNQPFTGTFLTQGAGVIDFGNSTTLGWSSNATYILNGPYMKIFSVNGTIDLGALSGSATIGTWYNGCTPTLRVGALGASTSFAGTIVDNLGGGGRISLVKTGVGTLTLSGANTYTGATTISGGTLKVNGSVSGSGTVTVAAGTLAGTGTLSGVTTVATGTFLSPGDLLNAGGVGTLTVGATTLATGATLAVQINGTTCDLLNSTGTLDVNNGTLTITGSGSASPLTAYTIVTAARVTGRFAGLPGTGFPVSGTTPTLYVNYYADHIQLSPIAGIGTVYSIR